MTRRIILHVGSPKCGSTYLQRVMRNNADTLRARGIHYPEGPEDHPGNAGDIPDWTRDRYDSLWTEGVQTLFLSHEDLFSRPKLGQPMLDFARADGTPVQVVFFLRPFSEFLFGDYSQFMKQNFWRYLKSRNPYDGKTFRDIVERRADRLKPSKFITNWQSAVRQPKVVVAGHLDIKPVVERLLGPGPDLDWDVPAHATNPSLRMEDCERIADAMRAPGVPDAVIEQMYRDAFHRVGRPDAGRSLARRRVIEALFEEENALILSRYGYDNRLKLDGPDID